MWMKLCVARTKHGRIHSIAHTRCIIHVGKNAKQWLNVVGFSFSISKRKNNCEQKFRFSHSVQAICTLHYKLEIQMNLYVKKVNKRKQKRSIQGSSRDLQHLYWGEEKMRERELILSCLDKWRKKDPVKYSNGFFPSLFFPPLCLCLCLFHIRLLFSASRALSHILPRLPLFGRVRSALWQVKYKKIHINI